MYTMSQAYARAKAKADAHASNRVGYCAAEVIPGIFGIAGPWKWGGNGAAYAYNFFLASRLVVKTSDPMKIPKGAMLFHAPRPGATTAGGKAGHIAVGAGDGYEFSTDMAGDGHWGKVKISHVEQVWGKKLVGYVLIDGMGHDVRDKATTVKAPTPWFKLGEYNLAGFDTVHGKASWDDRDDALVANLRAINADVYIVLELPDGKVKSFAAKLAKAGYTLGPGTDGRYVVTRTGVRVGRHAVYTLPTTGPAKDNKQAVYAEVFPTNDNAVLIGGTQLEYRDGGAYDTTRVQQAKEFLKRGNERGDEWGIPSSRRFYPLDENSDSRVAAEAFGTTWPDGATTAAKQTNTTFATFQGWGKKLRKAAPIDKIHVHKTRPIISARVETQTQGDSDHIAKTLVVASL